MKYTKRPVVKRFRLQETKPGRVIRKATVERRERKRKLRSVKRGRNMRRSRKPR